MGLKHFLHFRRPARPQPLGTLRRCVQNAVLAVTVAAMASPAFADLPTVTTAPGAQQGDLFSNWRGYMKLGIGLLVLILCAVAFVKVAGNALEKYNSYTDGRVHLSELKVHIIVGVTMLAIIIWLLTQANSVL